MIDPIKPARDVDVLARRLPRHEPSSERSAAMRRAVLEAAQASPPRWTATPASRAIGLTIAAAAVCVLLAPLAFRSPGPVRSPEPTHAAEPTHAPAPARAPEPAAAPSDLLPEGVTAIEAARTVHVTRGGATITAPPGARFEVDVHGDRIKRVTVTAGWVVIAGAHTATTVVAERQSWAPDGVMSAAPARSAATGSPTAGSLRAAPPPAAPPRVAPSIPAPPPHGAPPASRPAAPPARAELPTAKPALAREPSTAAAIDDHAPAAAEQDFHDGLRALLAGQAAAATAPLDRACGATSNSQGDVCYWAAVAWLRAGDRGHARRSLGDLLARWPDSTHAGEASIALGWLLLEGGDRVAARTRFAAAANDPSPNVRADAARGLAAAQ